LLFAITCLLIGAFLDLKISSFLAGASQEDWRNHTFGNYFSFIPGLLCALLLMFVGPLLVLTQPHKFKSLHTRIIYLIIAYLLMGGAVSFCAYDGFIRELSYSFVNTPLQSWALSWNVLFAIGVSTIVMTITSLIIHFKIKDANKHTWYKWAILVFVVLAIQWLIVFLLKQNIVRERYLWIMDPNGGKGDESLFKPWYSLIWNQSQGSGFNYASFPSGHVNWATTLIPIVLLPTIIFQRKLWAQICPICFIVIIIAVTMFARVQPGYHFLSDTSTTVFIASVCNLVIYLAIYRLNLIKLP
jgi:hypothetical protein